MDWVGAMSTAVVGLAGIAATAWGSTSSQRHQSRRAEIDEERGVYANLFARADQVVNAVRRVRTPLCLGGARFENGKLVERPEGAAG